MKKKRNWKFWTGRTVLFLLTIAIVWAVNFIWFRPFNIKHFYTKVAIKEILNSPEGISSVGIPVAYDWSKDELDDISDEKLWKNFHRGKENYATLMSYDFARQSTANQLNTKILAQAYKTGLDGEAFFYHGYPVNQMRGIQNGQPDFMVRYHKLRNKSDAKAYIARLSQFERKFDQLIDNLKIREEKEIIPPRFVVDKVLIEMNGFIGADKEKEEAIQSNILYTNFESKINKLDKLSQSDKEAFLEEVKKEIESSVFVAYGKLIDYFEKLKQKATSNHGVWKLPDGEAYYQYQLAVNTNTNYTPEEVHQIGLSEVARIKQEMLDILSSEGYTDTTQTLGTLVNQVSREDRFLFPNNDEGREMVLEEYNGILAHISDNLEEAFSIRPKAALEVQRVPEFREEGSPAAYYVGPALDGSRGGVFYTNLRDVHETSKFEMKTLAYHEGIPGHHFQKAIQKELKGVPMFRNVLSSTAYGEGWALYAEQLAWELGFYKDDPFGNLGRLQYEMWRSVRLVVDSGIHYKRWSRERAIKYMVENTGMPESEATTEIERYFVLPGQACSYKIGMIKILELRARAKEKLGDRFSLAGFHKVVLESGSVPLNILEEIVEDYINKSLGNGKELKS